MNGGLFLLFVGTSAVSMTIGATIENWKIHGSVDKVQMRLMVGLVIDAIMIALLSLFVFVISHISWKP